jgi:hypothetical protein
MFGYGQGNDDVTNASALYQAQFIFFAIHD